MGWNIMPVTLFLICGFPPDFKLSCIVQLVCHFAKKNWYDFTAGQFCLENDVVINNTSRAV